MKKLLNYENRSYLSSANLVKPKKLHICYFSIVEWIMWCHDENHYEPWGYKAIPNVNRIQGPEYPYRIGKTLYSADEWDDIPF